MQASTLIDYQVDTPSLAISPDGVTLVTGTNDGRLNLLSLPDGAVIRSLDRQPGFVNRVTFSPNNNLFAACSTNVDSPEGSAHVWSTSTWELIAQFSKEDIGGGQSLTFTPDSEQLIIGHADGYTRIWHLSDHTIEHVFQETSEIPIVAVGNKNLVAIGNDEIVKVWGLDEKDHKWTFSGHFNWISDMEFSPDCSYLAVCSAWGPSFLWDITTGMPVCELLKEKFTNTIAFSPDGKRLACGCLDGYIIIVSIPEGKIIESIEAHDKWVRDLRFTPDGLSLISSGTDGVVNLWKGIGK